ncbi:MAG: hypothetical protein C4547_09990 [Phycisphaerales bacterium]|nr:MAG: hypothetical protein C4547_09990 [Phycisphaerales bacterium]
MDDFDARIQLLSVGRALAILRHAESVAADRYRSLCERTDGPTLRTTFQELADLKEGNLQRVEKCLHDRYPGSDFVLTAEERELVTVGTLLPERSGPDALDEAIRILHQSELRTGRFCASLREHTPDPSLKPLFNTMADECADHAGTLAGLLDRARTAVSATADDS